MKYKLELEFLQYKKNLSPSYKNQGFMFHLKFDVIICFMELI